MPVHAAPSISLVEQPHSRVLPARFTPVVRRAPTAVEAPLVTRVRLGEWGFRRLPDVWLPCPREGRCTYFERWYQAQWNYTAIIGWPGKDPLVLREDDFLAEMQAHILDDTEGEGHDPWDDIYGGF